MTIAFYENRARHPLSTATLVLVDVCQGSATARGEIAASDMHHILERCQRALEAARDAGVPVVFVHDQQSNGIGLLGTESRWFSGFKPRRYESVVASKGPSCYGSPYFSEILDGAGRSIVLAGLVGLGAATTTAADALRHGHRLTLLSDAVGFDCAALIRSSHATQSPAPDADGKGDQGHLAVHAIRTEDWLAEIASASPPPRAARWQAGLQLRR